MHIIVVMNPKGGCGKSTVATNIAGYYASRGKVVALADCDPQFSSQDWVEARPAHCGKVNLALPEAGSLHVEKKTEILVIDTPAALRGKKLVHFLRRAEHLVIPVLASPVDMRAAERFIRELLDFRGIVKKKIKVATVANRIREDTLVAARLVDYLGHLKLPSGKPIPFKAILRQSRNYLHAAERGLSIFEFAKAATAPDRKQWQPLIRWLKQRHR